MVTSFASITAFLDSPAYIRAKAQINAEVNAHKISIDYSCFKKTADERLRIAVYKHEYKTAQRKAALQSASSTLQPA